MPRHQPASPDYLQLKTHDHSQCPIETVSDSDRQPPSSLREVPSRGEQRRSATKQSAQSPVAQEQHRDPSFEPEFDGDLEHQSWVENHIFDDRCGY